MIQELKQVGKTPSSLTSAGNTYVRWLKFFTIPHLPKNDDESAVSIDFEITNKF